VDRTVEPCVRCHCDAFVIERKYIAINPVEELLIGIGIVHGKNYENAWRRVLARLEVKNVPQPLAMNLIGSDLASLLDYARLLEQDPTATDMIKKRVQNIDAALRFHGVSWTHFKEFLVGMLDGQQ